MCSRKWGCFPDRSGFLVGVKHQKTSQKISRHPCTRIKCFQPNLKLFCCWFVFLTLQLDLLCFWQCLLVNCVQPNEESPWTMFSMLKFLLVYLLFVEDYGAVEIHGQPLVYNFSVSLQFLSNIYFGS